MNTTKQRAIIVDDHSLVRSGIRRIIEWKCPFTEVVGDTKSGRDALRLIPELEADLVVTDLSMPDMDGIGLIKKVRKRFPDVKCIVLSMHTGQEYVLGALRAGACAYVHKGAASDELLEALKVVYGGSTYLHPTVAGAVVDKLRDLGDGTDLLEALTDRQREILKLIAEGHATRQIAEKLNVSAKTVETHRAQLMDRLEIHDIPGLVKYAIRAGLIDLEDS